MGQRVFAITLGYENPIDHDDLRHDSVMAGKSTLNRLELSLAESTPYHRTSHDPAAVEAGFVDLFVEAHAAVPSQIVLDLDATDDPLHGYQGGGAFCYYATCCYLPLYVFCGRYGAARTSSGRPCGKANPRFVVTSLKPEDVRVRRLYETLYCARGKMENRIRECQLGLFADRSSSCSMRTTTNCGYGLLSWPMCCSVRCVGSVWLRPTWLGRVAAASGSNCWRLPRWYASACGGSSFTITSARPYQSAFKAAPARLSAAAT